MNPSNENKYNDIDALLNGLFKEVTLREMFDKRLHELKTNQTEVQKLLKIQRRSINGVIDSIQRRADIKTYNKLATFLNIPPEQVIQMHITEVEKKNDINNSPLSKKKFIRDHFDLTVLKKANFIDNVDDFDAIEKKVISFFGLTKLSEYEKRSFDVAFSEVAIKSSNVASVTITKDFWLTSAKILATKLDNPYPYNRQKLIEYFPQIRWNSTNVAYGLINVIKALYRLGITVVYQSKFSSLHLRGATFAVNNKPCIVLTDYKGFYPTLWHCLIHELYHVLFDWDEIKTDSYRISDDPTEALTIDEREVDADEFARDYLFSLSKLDDVKLYMRDRIFIEEVAKANNVHPSFIYVYYAYEYSNSDRKAWGRARIYNADIKNAIYRLNNDWASALPIEDFAKKLKLEIYN